MPAEFCGCTEIKLILLHMLGNPLGKTTEQPTHSALSLVPLQSITKGAEKGFRQVWVTWEEVNWEFDSAVCRGRR